MGQEKREFFRFDVSIPIYIEPMSDDGACLIASPECLTGSDCKQQYQQLNELLKTLFKDEKYIQNGGVKLFDELNQKLEFMIWLIELIGKGQDPREEDDFEEYFHQQKQINIPQGGHASDFIALLQAFYIRVDEITAELLDVVDRSVQGKVFMFHQASLDSFDYEHYFKKLPVLAQNGQWLAVVAEILCRKLNCFEDLLRLIKEAGCNLSNSDSWPIESVNLAAGGFALFLESDFVVGDRVCALFLLDDQFVLGQGKCVHVQPSSSTEDLARFSFNFESIGAEDKAHIVRFLTSKELEDRSED